MGGLSPTQKQVISLQKAHSMIIGTHTVHLQMTAHEGTEQWAFVKEKSMLVMSPQGESVCT